MEIIDRFKPNEFSPPPSVESVLLQLNSRGRPIIEADEQHHFEQLVQAGFAQPKLNKGLRTLFSKVQLRRLSADYRFGLDCNASDLSFSQWLGVFRYYMRQVKH